MTPEQNEIISSYVTEVPVRLGAMAQELGLEVYRSSLNPNISGSIEPSETAPSGYEIKLNRHESKERQRFTLAHEIGHFLLHQRYIGRGIVDNKMYRSNLSSVLEVEANKMAAALVMPMDRIKDKMTEYDISRDEKGASILAEIFRVSLSAMKIRLGI